MQEFARFGENFLEQLSIKQDGG